MQGILLASRQRRHPLRLISIEVSTPRCGRGNRGSIPRLVKVFFFVVLGVFVVCGLGVFLWCVVWGWGLGVFLWCVVWERSRKRM